MASIKRVHWQVKAGLRVSLFVTSSKALKCLLCQQSFKFKFTQFTRLQVRISARLTCWCDPLTNRFNQLVEVTKYRCTHRKSLNARRA